jgi:sucrose-6-phosphate hydrolase SacC (GH32 family)
MVVVNPGSITYTPSTGDSEEEYTKQFNKTIVSTNTPLTGDSEEEYNKQFTYTSTSSKPFVADLKREHYSEIHINSTTRIEMDLWNVIL